MFSIKRSSYSITVRSGVIKFSSNDIITILLINIFFFLVQINWLRRFAVVDPSFRLPVAVSAAAQTGGLHVAVQIERGLIIVRGLRRMRRTTRTTSDYGGFGRARRDRTLLGLARGLSAAIRRTGPRSELLRTDILTGRIRRASVCVRDASIGRRKKQT